MADSGGVRAVSPVVGVALLLVITLLLAAAVGAFALGLDVNRGTAEGIVDSNAPAGTATPGTPTVQDDLVVAENATPGAGGVVHSTVIATDAAVAGEELDEITVEYPKEEVDLELTADDELLTIGVDTDGDGDLEETFGGSDDVSGVNTNDDDSELTVGFTVGYVLAEGDRVQLRYENADNPDAAGTYDVSVTLNGARTVDGSLVVG